MWELFVFGSFGFWTLLVVSSFVLLFCVEKNHGGPATVTVIATLCLLNWFGQIPVFSYILKNPLVILPGVFGYFLIGAFWSIVKWFFYVKDQREKYDSLKENFIKQNSLSILVNEPIPDKFKELWTKSINGYYGESYRLEINPKVSNYKTQIFLWIAYWPLSFIWTIINDPVRKITNRIYNNIHTWLQSISDRYFKDTEQDFK